jgi:microsomal dipeptidase-like Zn-dependent dipeptidase
MLGLSLYPHHLRDNTNCTIESFCEMVAKTAEIMDLKNIGIGSDLCLDQPDTIVEWMRNNLVRGQDKKRIIQTKRILYLKRL